MSTKKEQMQRFYRYYREKVGRDVTMQEVALAAKNAGWIMPIPKDPIELLANEFSAAAREETRKDKVLGESYRANIAYRQQQGDKSITLWGDIDNAPRKNMVKNVALRREQMVGDALQLTIDARHWNRVNPNEEPIQPELDFTDDVEWRLNAPKEEKDAA
jgi:hypothetical protein